MPDAVPDLSAWVAGAAAEHPDAVALVGPEGVETTWADLEQEVERVARGLVGLGLVAGHRVGIALGNTREFVAAYLAALRVQAVAVPLNHRATAEELAGVLDDAGCRLAMAGPESLDAVRRARDLLAAEPGVPGVRVLVVGAAAEGDELAWEALPTSAGDLPGARDPERLAVLLYTSGASGRPKGAMLSHRALLANVEQVAAVDPPLIGADDVVLGLLPLFHVYGLNAVLGASLHRRARLVLVERYDPEATLDVVARHGCTVLPVAPPVFAHWQGEGVAERLTSVRLLLSGSAPLDAGLVAAFTERTGVPVHQGYGLTEAAPVVTSTLHSRRTDADRLASPRSGSVGAALPGVELRLVDEGGRTPEQGDPGQVEVRGANLFSGYWPDGAEAPDSEGWWATGDVGFLDPDGELFLVDRVKDVVIVSGFNVYPTEVEAVIADVPGIAHVAVIGVPDEETGEAVVAYVVAPGADPDRLEAAVQSRCAVRLARFKRPGRIEVVDSLPLTVTGKVRKGSLRSAERRERQPLL